MNQPGLVILSFGPMPISQIDKATKLCSEDAEMSPDIARMAGANIAMGSPSALARLRERLEAGALQAERDGNPGLSEAAAKWLAHGRRGVSSNTMFTHLTGMKALRDWSPDVPHDPGDFWRCRLLLEQVPELRPLLPKMRNLSPQWSSLVDHWQEICDLMDQEAPHWRHGSGSAPKTYELIQRCIRKPLEGGVS